MPTPTTKLATLTFAFLLLAVLITSSAADKQFITDTCKKTPNFKVCVSAALSNPRGLKAGNVEELALVIIDVVQAKATVAYNQIKKLLATKPDLKKPLSECAQEYHVVIHEDHDEAVEAVTKGDPKFGEDAMADSALTPDSCKDTFEQYKKAFLAKLTQPSNVVQETANVARALIRMLL
ncbi:Cell wall / vacuolar inhibitor of fructosidase 1 [Linum perenne]